CSSENLLRFISSVLSMGGLYFKLEEFSRGRSVGAFDAVDARNHLFADQAVEGGGVVAFVKGTLSPGCGVTSAGSAAGKANFRRSPFLRKSICQQPQRCLP
ncbi:hypothetical protein, partial [Novispirillum itersonii]|uniref:hypothetical protein n=1 Tax=Novispirillum itersonii TaxID=189 RepID=UPI001C86759F